MFGTLSRKPALPEDFTSDRLIHMKTASNPLKVTENTPTSQNQKCGYCGGDDTATLYPTHDLNGNRYIICRCRNCGFAFLTPRPTTEQLAQAYDDSYYGVSDTKFSPWIESILDFFRKTRSRRVQRYIGKGGTVLDIGCGNGQFLKYLLDEGYTSYGIERPGKSAGRAAKIDGLHLSTDPLTADSFSPQSFDAVCLWHVFEHLEAPKATLKMIHNFLKPGGYLFLSLPNIDSLQIRVFKGNWLHLDPPKHLIFPGPDTLVRELAAHGFEPVHKTFFSLEQNPFGIQQSLLNCLCKKREILFEALKGNSHYLKDVSKTSIFLQKLFYLTTFWFFAILALLESLVKKGGTMELVFRKKNA
jgi:2-polyprenyl-3-methyl-5-hydroxy-6-metoxy-1,4-benzoquinol methylase